MNPSVGLPISFSRPSTAATRLRLLCCPSSPALWLPPSDSAPSFSCEASWQPCPTNKYDAQRSAIGRSSSGEASAPRGRTLNETDRSHTCKCHDRVSQAVRRELALMDHDLRAVRHRGRQKALDEGHSRMAQVLLRRNPIRSSIRVTVAKRHDLSGNRPVSFATPMKTTGVVTKRHPTVHVRVRAMLSGHSPDAVRSPASGRVFKGGQAAACISNDKSPITAYTTLESFREHFRLRGPQPRPIIQQQHSTRACPSCGWIPRASLAGDTSLTFQKSICFRWSVAAMPRR